jgi:uncharacterized membrane protein (UPF0127 family)
MGGTDTADCYDSTYFIHKSVKLVVEVVFLGLDAAIVNSYHLQTQSR